MTEGDEGRFGLRAVCVSVCVCAHVCVCGWERIAVDGDGGWVRLGMYGGAMTRPWLDQVFP